MDTLPITPELRAAVEELRRANEAVATARPGQRGNGKFAATDWRRTACMDVAFAVLALLAEVEQLSRSADPLGPLGDSGVGSKDRTP